MYPTERTCCSGHKNTSLIIGILFIGFLCSLYGLVYYVDNILPTPLQLQDENKYPCEFNAQKARSYLETLFSIGPRPVGSEENEKHAINFLKREIIAIQNLAHLNHKIELDVQLTSGSYIYSSGILNEYANVQNVVVRVNSRNNSNHNLLINAHFDTTPTSPGGSDDGINCAIMLEVLRKVSTSSERPEHNIIFLFNGAQETLQASHGFITQHKWAKGVSVVINLEAFGAGGKAILLQTGPSSPWLLKYYQEVPYPNGQIAGEEMFQIGFIPLSTDFEIFVGFAKTVGLDIAFVRDGYRYHTKFDEFLNIPLGSYQHAGANLLSLVRNLANAPELSDFQVAENGIYFDVFGLFFIFYSKTVGLAMYYSICLLSFTIAAVSFYQCKLLSSCSSFGYLWLTLVVILLSWILSFVLVYAIAQLLDCVNFGMSWYRNPWIIFGLYVAPIILICCGFLVLLNKYYKKNKFKAREKMLIQLHSVRIIWTILLLTGTSLGYRFMYIIFIPLLFQILAFAIIHGTCIQKSTKKWLPIYVAGTVIPNIFVFHQALQICAVMIPVFGRMGAEKNPEIRIALIVAVLTIIVTSCYIPLITMIPKAPILLAIFGFIFSVFFIMVFTPLAFPYSGNMDSPSPQRLLIYHMSRLMRNDENIICSKDTGYFIIPVDRNGPNTISKCLKGATFTSLDEDCKKNLFCGVPLGKEGMPLIETSKWIQATETPSITDFIKLTLYSKLIRNDTSTQLSFVISGPSHMEIYISPRNQIVLQYLSDYNISSTPTNWNGRPVYVIMYNWGTTNTPLKFNIELSNPAYCRQPMIDIAVVGKYVNSKTNVKRFEYNDLLEQFPEWVDVLPYVGAYESWVY